MKSLQIIALSMIVGALFGLPHLMMKFSLEDPSAYTPFVITGVSFLTVDEAYTYAARVREVHDGHLVVTDSSVYEHKGDPWLIPFASEFFLGFLARIIGMANTFMVSDFVFPALIFYLLFCFFFQVTLSRPLSILASLAILLEGVRNSLGVFQAIVTGASNSFIRPFEFSRLVNPQLTFIPFILALICLVFLVERKETLYAVLGGLLFGSLFYFYLYYWLFFAVGSAIFLLFMLQKRERRLVTLVGAMLLIGFAISIPYWIAYIKFQSLADAGDIVSRLGLERNRQVIFPSVKTLGLIALFAFLYWKMRLNMQLLFQAFIVAFIICQNIQLFTGFNTSLPHWNYRVGYIWQSMMTFTSIAYLLSTDYRLPKLEGLKDSLLKRVLNPVCVFVTVLMLLSGFSRQIVMSKNLQAVHILPPGFQEAFDWLNKNTPKESVVMSSSFETNMLLPVYTHNNVFLPSGNSQISLSPTREILDRLSIAYCFFQVPYDYLASSLTHSPDREKTFKANGRRFTRTHPELLEQNALWYILHERFTSLKEALPRELQEEILSRHRSCGNSARPQLLRYRINYVWESFLEREKSTADFSAYPFLEKVYDNQGVRIYWLVEKGS